MTLGVRAVRRRWLAPVAACPRPTLEMPRAPEPVVPILTASFLRREGCSFAESVHRPDGGCERKRARTQMPEPAQPAPQQRWRPTASRPSLQGPDAPFIPSCDSSWRGIALQLECFLYMRGIAVKENRVLMHISWDQYWYSRNAMVKVLRQPGPSASAARCELCHFPAEVARS